MSKFMETVTNLRNVALLVTALAGAGGVFIGIQAHLDTTYASVVQVAELETRINLQELKELQQEALEEMYFWRKQHRKIPDDPEIKQKLKEAEEQIDLLKERIKEIKKEQL